MKKRFGLVCFFIFAFSHVINANDFSLIYENFYNSNFSESGRIQFQKDITNLKENEDTVILIFDNEKAKECFEKIIELSSKPMTEKTLIEFQYNYYLLYNFYSSTYEYGGNLFVIISIGFCVLISIMIFLVYFAMKKEEKYRRLKNLSEISKAVDEATFNVQAAERKNLYRTLHDSVSQNTKAEQIFIEKLYPYIANDKTAYEIFSSIKEIQKENLLQIRSILDDYNSNLDKTFCECMTELCENLKRKTAIDIKLFIQKTEDFNQESENIKEHIYNIIREAVNNSFRYSKCENISIIFRTESTVSNIKNKTLRIIDDGNGFNPKEVDISLHHGLEIMKKRASLINGDFTIKSDVYSGTEILIKW